MQAVFTDEVKQINDRIAELLGQPKYKVWFKNSTRMTFGEQTLEVACPNPFICNWIESHFQNEISTAVNDIMGRSLDIHFKIDSSLAGPEKTVSSTVKQQRQELVPLRQRLKNKPCGSASKAMPLKLSLDSYVVGEKNQLAFNAAQTVAREEKSPFNPLFYHGGYGVGKTHLLQGICNGIATARADAKWMYVSAEDFANQYVLALKTRKLDVFRARFRKLDVLAIDDIHFLANKVAMQEEFLHTFNSIDLAGKQIVLASDAHPKEITQLCEKLVSRFVSGMVVKIDPPDFATRCKICAQKALNMKVVLPTDVIEHVSSCVSNSVRELEGALVKLAAFASVSKSAMTLPLAKQILADHISRSDPVVRSSDIVSVAAEFFGVTPNDIHSAKKDRTVCMARSFSMYMTRRYTKMSFPEIGKSMGNKNHATVILANKKIEGLLNDNVEIKWKHKNGWRNMAARDVLDKLNQKFGGDTEL